MSESSTRPSNPLETPIRFVKGVGPKIAELLSVKGIYTAEDLLYYLPSRYLDRRSLSSIEALEAGQDKTIAVVILSFGFAYRRRRRPIFEMVVSDDTGKVRLRWFRFNHAYWQKIYKEGMQVLVSGRVNRFRGELQMIHPDVQILGDGAEEDPAAPGIIPLYPAVPKLGQKYLARLIQNAWNLCHHALEDPLPEVFRDHWRLVSLEEALSLLHFPPDDADIESLSQERSPAYRRLIFEELFFLELGLAIKRRHVAQETGLSIEIPQSTHEEHIRSLPFELTAAQNHVIQAISRDMARPIPMNRLLQGDVGSGKTVVALLAARTAVAAGYQVAVMAPTEILAGQHFRSFRALLGPDAAQVALLTASLSEREKKWLRLRLREGTLSIVIGTHALLSDDVVFKKLGFLVIDEQHRFGVMQRKALRAKACLEGVPDVLVMTATPIPRTLAMTLYGELDVSVIDEMPPGRKPVTTRVIDTKQRGELYEILRRFVERGEQIFIIYPLVEETEKSDLKAASEMAARLQKDVFPDLRVGLIHGRKKSEEKEGTMRDFKGAKIHILVATTVVEVGIDIPNATCMVIEHPERFGLSQLHQLRGRIGRGDKASLCLLVAAKRQTDEARRRLEVMERTNNGFEIAEADLEIRGPGEFLGTRQSGLPDLKFANLVRDVPILAEVRDIAFELLDEDPELTGHPSFKKVLYRRWSEKLSLAEVG